MSEGERLTGCVECDAVELLHVKDVGEPDRGVTRYGGPFVQGIALKMEAELEQWAYGTRAVLDE